MMPACFLCSLCSFHKVGLVGSLQDESVHISHPSFRIEIYNIYSGSETEVQELRIQPRMVLIIDLQDGEKKSCALSHTDFPDAQA